MIICSNILTSISRQVSYCTRVLFRIGLLDCCPIDSCMKRETKVNSTFLLLKSSKRILHWGYGAHWEELL